MSLESHDRSSECKVLNAFDQCMLITVAILSTLHHLARINVHMRASSCIDMLASYTYMYVCMYMYMYISVYIVYII
jgi:hypothetical protein